jgi:uncharacterized protein YecE (DUF72 family)
MSKLFCGTSGFAYASWKPDFYPPKLPAKDFLKHYATRLNSVEANYTFRRLPAQTTLESWVNCTPAGFVFAPKAHQRITHIQRLKPSQFTDVFFRAIDPLRTTGRLGPVLVQLPPNLKCDVDLLESFLAGVPEDIRYAFEFRNTTWLKDEVYRVLEKRGAALCLAESEKLVIPEVLTAPFVYARLRKPEYSAQERAEIAARAERFLAEGRDLYVYFKHEDDPAGALYAEELLRSCLTTLSTAASTSGEGGAPGSN